MPTAKEKAVYRIGASVWSKATASTCVRELHRPFGGLVDTTWFPGIVQQCITKPSDQGKNMKYVVVCYFRGKDNTKTACVPISAVHLQPPNGCNIPKDLSDFTEEGGVFPPKQPLQSHSTTQQHK